MGTKSKIYIVVAIVGVVLIGVGYWWISSLMNQAAEGQLLSDKAAQYDVMLDNIDIERDRCEKLISQQEGEFGDFEYCKQFVEWADSVYVKF